MIRKQIILYSLMAVILILVTTSCLEKSTIDSAAPGDETSDSESAGANGQEAAGEQIPEEQSEDDMMAGEIVFEDPVKTPHYVENIPEHGSIIPAVPVNIVINFNFDLGPGSDIEILGEDGNNYDIGDVEIDDNKLGMRKKMDSQSPDGLYVVKYKACWPDGSCHDGSFQFYIDSSKREDFQDMKGQTGVTVDMVNITFDPAYIIIDEGTTITWVNKDSAAHYINTDPHPGHNYYPDQNSSSLTKGDEYSVTFDMPGYYPYHCSAHPVSMRGTIIVE